MPRSICGISLTIVLALCGFPDAQGQVSGPTAPPRPALSGRNAVSLTVVDQHGAAVADARVTIEEPGQPAVRLTTDYAGRCNWTPRQTSAYSLRIERGGFYETTAKDIDPGERSLHLVLTQQEVLQQEVSVHASTPGIDPDQVSNKLALNVPEIVNIPFPTNNDIRNLLPFTPSVVADSSGQIHVAGGETYMTLDTLDGFDIRNPVYGTLDLRISTDAVRAIDTETTRYPVEYGRATGGVVAFTTGMGDNKFRYDATNFVPSLRDQNGIRFDTFEPRITFSGPIRRNRAWYFDGIDTQYSQIYIPELPSSANTDDLSRAGNLLKFQFNLGTRNNLTTALLWNDYHSPYDGLSAITPQQSTDNHDILAWLPYARDQHSFRNGIVVDTGFGDLRYREGYEPHGAIPFDLTPELSTGSDFINSTTRSQRFEGYADAWLPPHQWQGSHQFRAGIDLDHIRFTENVSLAPVNYLREDGTLERQSTFPAFAPFTRNNLEAGAYVEDRWTPRTGLLVEPGVRFDWDEIIRKPLWSPRLAFNYSPPGTGETTFSAGIGVYYEHTQLEYLTRALAGLRNDTYYAADGKTPAGPPLNTTFTANDDSLQEPHALNWSVGVRHRLPGQIYLGANFMQKATSNEFLYANQNGSGALSGPYVLTNDREDHYHSVEVDARRTFRGSYALFGAYTHSSATTNSALDYIPTIPVLGPQQSGPLFWDVPNRVISWGWLPAWAPYLPTVHKNWDFVYTLDWHNGFPFDSINANEEIVGPAGSHRFPNYFDFSPGLEWRFHFWGKYLGLRGTAENITNSPDPYIVFNNVDSPQYLTFSQPLGRAFTTRIRLIQSSR
ncbi:MAG TPA: carboxypeptidase regulatory-like domain-containing protein [Acidobacteriaceae bacterium]|jgi:hypothetical protein|nr:carboxypeptidase regulatory-like domain-containing protein [Acidobacteriaceae bacterium]